MKLQFGRSGMLACHALCTLLAALGTSSASVALPALARAFGASFPQVQWVLLAYLIAVTGAVVGAGWLGDLAGRRRMLMTGLAVFSVASLACALAPTLAFLVAARAAQGLGAALMLSMAMALAAGGASGTSTGSAMGLLGAMSAVGTSLGPTLGGGLLAGLGWPAIFFINVPLGLAALLFAYCSLPQDQSRVTNARAASPPAGLGTGLVTSAMATSVVMATLVVGPFYLADAFGLGPAGTGLAMSAGPLAAAMAGWPAGRLVDRMGASKVALGGLASMAAGSLWLAWSPHWLGVAGYVLPLMVLTSGYAAFQAANNTAVMSSVLPSQRGAAAGLLTLSRNLGLIAGASLMGTLFAYGSMPLTFGVALVLLVISMRVAGRSR